MKQAVQLEGIWKSYLKGSGAYRYQTLRDTLAAGAARLIGRKPTTAPRSRFWALEDVTFDLEPGTTTGLIGRNGAGKTTLLKVMSRITLPTRGEARIKGRVGSLLEVGTGFHPELTGRENVLLNGAILGMTRTEVLAKFDQIVDFAGVSEFIDTPVKRYSSGMSMRLAFSVAAHLEPELMLVDEVLAVGDNEFQKRCLNRIIEVAQEGRTVVFVSHNMGSVERVCDRAVLLNEGRLEAIGPTQEVVDSYHKLALPEQVSEDEILAGIDTPKFFKWTLDSSGSIGSYSTLSGSACTISFRIAVPEAIPDAFFGLAIYTAENTLAYAASSFDLEEHSVDLSAGLHEAVFTLPSLPLGRGQYYLMVSLNGLHHGTIATWNAHPSMEIVRARESVQIPAPWEGVLAVPASFDLRPVEPSRTAPSPTSGPSEDSSGI